MATLGNYEIDKMIIEKTSETIQNEAKIDFDLVYQAALQYKKAFEEILKLSKNNAQFSKKRLELQSQLLANIKNLEQKTLRTQKMQEVARLGLIFVDYLAQYQGKLPLQAIYVYKNKKGTILESYVMPLKDLANFMNYEGKIIAYRSRLQNSYNTIENLLEEHQDKIQIMQQKYQEINKKLEKFYSFQKKINSNTQRQNLAFRYKTDVNNSRYVYARVGNEGNLKEAYVQFLLSGQLDNIEAMLPENTMTLFEQYGLTKVDNQSSLVNEDIISSVLNPNMIDQEYAVKSQKSTLSLGQYYTMALKIVNKGVVSAQEITNFIEKEYKINNPTQQITIQEIDKETKQLVAQVEKSFKKS